MLKLRMCCNNLEGTAMSKGKENQETCLVKCRVEPGVFRTEWLAFLDAINPETNALVPVQLFVDEREVAKIRGTPKRNQPAEAWLRASRIRARGGMVQIVLPQPATPLGETVFVKHEQVECQGRKWVSTRRQTL
jgi:hypothetical protein